MAYPANPTNGQIYGNKRFNSAKNGWEFILDNSIVQTGSSGATIIPGAGGNYNEGLRIATASNGYAEVFFGTDSSGSGTIAGQWAVGKVPTTHDFVIATATGERLRITNNTGATAGGTSGPGVSFSNAGFAIDRGWSDNPSISVANTPISGVQNTATTAGGQGVLRIHGTNNSSVTYPAASGSDFSVNVIADGTITSTSDRRFKTNIVSISGALNIITKMDGKRFQTKNSAGEIELDRTENGFRFGFIAQELESANLGELYKHYADDDDGTDGYNKAYAVDYASVTAILVNSTKELLDYVKTLEERIKTLENK
jgi:hypothetical protein